MQMEMALEGGGPLTARRRKRRGSAAEATGTAPQLCLDLSPAGRLPRPARATPPAMAEPDAPPPSTGAPGLRAERGRRGYLSGIAAEDSVARHYARKGRVIEARRWRGPGGEIDLIAREGARLVFVEVKASRSFDAAVARLTRRQIARIRRSAEAYCGEAPEGLLTEMRFDLALVDGRGAVHVMENAFDGG
jgi:putative endonuclease